jgi:hypothetical protein
MQRLNRFLVFACAVVIGFSLMRFPAPAIAAPMSQVKDGDLIQSDDGSLYVMEDGALHRIQPVVASADQLQSAKLGEPVTTGVMIIPPPAVAAPPPLYGEAFGVRVTVLGIQRPVQTNSNPGAGKEWAMIRIRIQNLREETLQVSDPILSLQIQDAGGSVRDSDHVGVVPPVADALSEATLPPGGQVEGNALFGISSGSPAIAKVLWAVNRNPREVVEAPVP